MGYNQNDSQEMLQFALDGLHEDLNRVIDKPQVETKDSDGRPDLIVAEEHWNAFQMRNKSILVDLMYGQYKSRLVCPKCNKVSITYANSLPTRTHTYPHIHIYPSTHPPIHPPTYTKHRHCTQALHAGATLFLAIRRIHLIKLQCTPQNQVQLIPDGVFAHSPG